MLIILVMRVCDPTAAHPVMLLATVNEIDNMTNTGSKIANLDELLALHDEKFVENAYWAILRRAPDSEGARHYLERVRAGAHKLEILGQLNSSKECAAQPTILPGLEKAVKNRLKVKNSIRYALRRLIGNSDLENNEKLLRLIENRLYRVDALFADISNQLTPKTSSDCIRGTEIELVWAEKVDWLELGLQQQKHLMLAIEERLCALEISLAKVAQEVGSSRAVSDQPPPAKKDAYSTRLAPSTLEDVKTIDYRFWKTFVYPCDVDIIVCVHNALDDVKRCLSSVIRFCRPPCRIIIVDDGSRDDTRDYLRSFCTIHRAVLIRNDDARGYTLAANQGLRASIAGYSVLLNSDTIVSPGWIEKLLACAESDPKIGMVGPLSNTASWQSIPEILDNGDWATNPLPEGFTVTEMASLVAKYSAHVFPRISFLNGFCLMIRRAVINDIGIFDEEAFGRGYGEENDYCLRARNAGWHLAIADNAYVFHAQSKSYSHEKRKVLADHAGKQLSAKHGDEIIARGVEQCHWDSLLLSIRAHARTMSERERLISDGRTQWGEGRRVLFVLPVMHAGGGANVVVTEARAMLRMGVNVAILNLLPYRTAFEQSYPNLDVPVLYAETPEDIPGLSKDFDAVVATANLSVQWIASLASVREGPVLGYYVQDFEPYFFDKGTSAYDIALASYSLVPQMRLFTKTEWNREEVATHTGLCAEIVGASYDVDLFRPWVQRPLELNGEPIRITAMVRPASPRRNPEGTIAVLSELKKRYGAGIEVLIFGAGADGPPIPTCANDNMFLNYGQLRPAQTARVLSSADIFLDMSFFQAMGLTAMEAMACGCVAVIPSAGGAASFAVHNVNAIVVDTANLPSVVEAVAKLIEDAGLRQRLRVAALNDVVQHFPEKAALRILECLFEQPRTT
jgi:GT2 family glycosyltransferase/glycosyltransferase involved in cell wall biosynthesis